MEFTTGSVWPVCPGFFFFFPSEKRGGCFVFKTHLDAGLGCNWIAQLEELGSVARFPDIKR